MSVVVFLGPSLPLAQARRVLSAKYLPPARQGDVFRVLPSRPKVIVLIDGVFEAVPSVWHHELRAALASGVHVIGASSMGALRAAELHGEGMHAVGAIAKSYVDGSRRDDADVALLHGDAESKYRPLTVPLVNVEATVAKCRGLTRDEKTSLLRAARQSFFKDRTWHSLVAAQRRWDPERREAVLALLRDGVVDQKAIDAVAALRFAKTLQRRKAPVAKVLPLSSFVRRRRLLDAHADEVERLTRLANADELAASGLRTLLLASFAKSAGLEVEAPSARIAGVALDEAAAHAEAVALEQLVLSAPERFVADGPSWLEGLIFEARRHGVWRAR